MDTLDTRPCPYCAEDVAPEAVRCPHCRSRLVAFDLSAWYRDHPERKVAGVAAALGHALAVPVMIVRAAFVVFTLFVLHVGPVVYGGLWLLIPFEPGGEPPLERALGEAYRTLRRWRHADVPPEGPLA
jgi:phage shock protein PspC (stress-responsive transcriptional regulator)